MMLQTELLSKPIERQRSWNTVVHVELGVFQTKCPLSIDLCGDANTVISLEVLRVFSHFSLFLVRFVSLLLNQFGVFLRVRRKCVLNDLPEASSSSAPGRFGRFPSSLHSRSAFTLYAPQQ